MGVMGYWICELALLGTGLIYIYTIEPRMESKKRYIANIILILLFFAFVNYSVNEMTIKAEVILRFVSFSFLVHIMRMGRVLSRKAALYYAIWAFMSWQLLYELWMILAALTGAFEKWSEVSVYLGELSVFAIGHIVIAYTIGKWMPDGGRKKIGPRQLTGAVITFLAFQMLVFIPENMGVLLEDDRWMTVYIAQVLLGVILYLQNELFKKSELRGELEMMNLLWEMEKEQYQFSKENIALINQKCHDLKHQIRALRNASQEEINKYLDEIEESVQIYEAIVKTGNEVLDTILTEKSLYCKKKGITVSCVADGSQLDFIDTVDLYAILGNAIDNAIEAVEKFKTREKRQIDVLIYRQQQFLAINVINPIKGNLVFDPLAQEETGALPITTKHDKNHHGFGLRSMKYMLKKYDGVLNISEEDGVFSLMMLIPVPKKQTNFS